MKFYKSRRFDANIGLPKYVLCKCVVWTSNGGELTSKIPINKVLFLVIISRPNDFHDISEYFVLEVMQRGRICNKLFVMCHCW